MASEKKINETPNESTYPVSGGNAFAAKLLLDAIKQMNPLLSESYETTKITGEFGKNWEQIVLGSIPNDYIKEFERIKWALIRYFVNQDDVDLAKMSPVDAWNYKLAKRITLLVGRCLIVKGEKKDVPNIQEEQTKTIDNTTKERRDSISSEPTNSTVRNGGNEDNTERKNAKGDFGNAKGNSFENSRTPSFIVKIFSIATEGDDGLVKKWKGFPAVSYNFDGGIFNNTDNTWDFKGFEQVEGEGEASIIKFSDLPKPFWIEWQQEICKWIWFRRFADTIARISVRKLAYTVNDEEQRNVFMSMIADENIGYVPVSGIKKTDGKSQIPNSVTKVGEGSSTTSEIDGILQFIDWKKKDIFDLMGIVTNNSGDKTSYTNQGQSNESISFAKTVAKDFATNIQIAFRLIGVELPTKSQQENISPLDRSDEESSKQNNFGEDLEKGGQKDDNEVSE